MQPTSKKTQSARMLFICFLCIGVYICLKMQRNSLGGGGESQGGIWNLFNAFFVILALIPILMRKKLARNVPSCIKAAFFYSCVALFFSLINMRSLSIAFAFRLLMLFYFPSVMMTFYMFSNHNIKKWEKRFFMFLFYIVSAFSIYLMSLWVGGNKQIMQADMYFCLCLLPFVFLWKRGISFYLPLILVTSAVLLSAKRTALLALVFGLLIYYFLEMRMSHKVTAFFKTLLKIGIAVLVLVFIYNYLSANFSINILERLKNLSEDGGSGRDDIYATIWQGIVENHPLYWLTGHGNGGTLQYFNRTSSAHNDFLEIMFNYGIFAVSAILVFYIRLIKLCRKMVKCGYTGAPAFAASIVISLFMSMFSNYLITFTHITGMAAFWGVCLADWKRYETSISLRAPHPQIDIGDHI